MPGEAAQAKKRQSPSITSPVVQMPLEPSFGRVGSGVIVCIHFFVIGQNFSEFRTSEASAMSVGSIFSRGIFPKFFHGVGQK